jgi:hypothetical protein
MKSSAVKVGVVFFHQLGSEIQSLVVITAKDSEYIYYDDYSYTLNRLEMDKRIKLTNWDDPDFVHNRWGIAAIGNKRNVFYSMFEKEWKVKVAER